MHESPQPTADDHTVRVRVSTEIEPHFRRHLHLLGAEARIDAATPCNDGFFLDLDVYIPDAPADAVRAEPVYRVEWRGDRRTPILCRVDWLRADGTAVQPS